MSDAGHLARSSPLRRTVHDPAARPGAAVAGEREHVTGDPVVEQHLLAPLDPAEAHQRDAPLADPGDQVGLAAVVDELGAAPAYGAVDGPFRAHPDQVDVGP